jgi:type II secretory ATPase GspE/PulE/Tfp pilus assembly ATPase PilB-like protein
MTEDQSSAPEVLERLVQQAEGAGASDIHLQMGEGKASIWFRLDGVMTPTSELHAEVADRVFGRIKFLARLKTYQESLPQDGRIDKAALSAHSDIRVATYPTVTGEKIVLRLFSAGGVKALEELGFAAEPHAELERFLNQTAGLLLLTGPAGSGKTTTIYACLRALSERGGRHIITVEDPAEQIVPGVMQTEINEVRGLSFATAARHLLRQDPQVLVIGEIRDEETANIAVRAALTGHLVISTLHAGSCKGVFERLLVLCKDHSAVAACVELVLNQRLLRRVCVECSGGDSTEERADSKAEVPFAGQSAPLTLALCPKERERGSRRPAHNNGSEGGCAMCMDTGYHGRVPLVEWLRVSDSMRPGLAAGSAEGLAAHTSLVEGAKTLVRDRVTNIEEVGRVLGKG